MKANVEVRNNDGVITNDVMVIAIEDWDDFISSLPMDVFENMS